MEILGLQHNALAYAFGELSILEQVWHKFLYGEKNLEELVNLEMTQEKSGKKVVSRTIAIALGVVCIILVAGLVGVIATYTPMMSDLQSQVANKDSTITSLNSTVTSLSSTVTSLGSQVSSLNSQVASLKSSLNESQSYYEEIVSDYSEKLSLSQYGYLVNGLNLTQDAGTVTAVWTGYVEYAGYVVINLESTSNTTLASVAYSLSSRGVNFDYNSTVGTSGTKVFPVLPGELTVEISNTETANAVNAIITAVYYY